MPHTLSQDGDPIDVLVANTRPIIPGAIINVRPIGVLKMVDDGGTDEKIIAVPTLKLTQHYEHVRAYTDLPRIALEQIQHFFEHYKDLEPGKWVKLIGWGDVEEAKQLIRDAIRREQDPLICPLVAETSRARLVLPVLNEVVDHGGIGQRRGVAEIGEIVLGDLAQDAAHDLAGARLGQAGRELDQIGRGDRADLLAHPVAQLDLEQLVRPSRRPSASHRQ